MWGGATKYPRLSVRTLVHCYPTRTTFGLEILLQTFVHQHSTTEKRIPYLEHKEITRSPTGEVYLLLQSFGGKSLFSTSAENISNQKITLTEYLVYSTSPMKF